MPSIVIKEIDETTGGGRVGSTDIVYVPGFRADSTVANAWPKKGDGSVDVSNAAPVKEPILCETIAEFKKYFGKEPVNCSTDLYYGSLALDPNQDPKDVANAQYGQTPITKDLSYIYAIELLNNGIPVLYEAVDAISNLDKDTLKSFYTYLADSVEGPFGKLRERGEFDVKYLTTGGYYNFDVAFGKLVKFSIVNPIPKFMIVKPKSNISTLYNIFLQSGCKAGSFKIIGQESPGFDWEFINKTPENEFTLNGETASSYVTTYFEFEENDGGIGNGFDFVIDEISGDNLIDVMADCAKARGDAIAFIDPVNNKYQPLVGQDSYYNKIAAKVQNWGDTSTYATTFIPSVNIDTTQLASNDTYLLPGSYAYLAALGQSINTNPNWLAIAGAARGGIPKLNGANPFDLQKRLTNTIAENEYQNRDGISINAITNIKPFGQRIWGNRTLKNNALEGNLTATSFLNIRNLVCDVKKIVYQACRKYTFEQNNDILWTNFKAYIEPTLEKMRTGAGISGYKIIKGTTTEKAKLVATIRLYPVYAIEDFEITVVMSDDEVSIS